MKKLCIFLVCCLFFISTMAVSAAADSSDDVMIQGFNWESNHDDWYAMVQNKAADLKESGIDMIWMPPPTDSASDEGYLPRVLYDLDTAYGSMSDLKACIAALHGNGIKVLADIVINHRVGLNDWADFYNPTWDSWAVCKNDEWQGATGDDDSGAGYDAARDLDHGNDTVQTDLISWIKWLKNDVGFDGWRFDYTKGYWGGYTGSYNKATDPYFSVGELWPDITGDYYASCTDVNYHRQKIMDWINATDDTSSAFDFTTKWQLQLALERNELWRLGCIPGAIGWWPSRSVTFLDNHDTGSTQAHWPFPNDKVLQGYAYILTHPGIPCIFWDHFYEWGLHDQIKAMIKIRKQMGVTSTSTLRVHASEWNLYAAEITGANGDVAVKIGSGAWTPPGDGWALNSWGTDYAIWSIVVITDQ